MNEEFGPEAQMDAMLRRAARAFTYPPTPAIAAAVEARVRELPLRLARIRSAIGWLPDAVLGWWLRPAPRLVISALAVAVLIVVAALAIPRSRSAIADFFGLSHVRVEVGPTAGPTPPVLSPQSFARPSSVDEAQHVVDFALRFPTFDGQRLSPDAVYVEGEASNMPTVIFVYEKKGFDVYQTKLGFFGKGGPDPSLVHQISFAGHPAFWIDEGGHIASFLDDQGRVVVESRRTVGRATLLWEQNGITYRLETDLRQEQAIQVAESLH
jgi:hypothetical protein